MQYTYIVSPHTPHFLSFFLENRKKYKGYYKRMQREGLGKNVSRGVLVKKGSAKY